MRTSFVPLAATVALLFAGCATDVPAPLPTQPLPYGNAVTVAATPAALNPAAPAVDQVGDFAFAGSIVLAGTNTSRLHGLSDLKIVGDEIYSVTDDGADAFEARLVLGADGRLAGLADARLAPLKGADGQPMQGKDETDAEGMALMPTGDRLYSFERHHRILRYPRAGGPPVAAPSPARPMPENDGMEGLAAARRLAADAYWVGVEDGEVWLCRLSAACQRKPAIPRPPAGFRLSSLTEAPNGDLVLLHHRYDPLLNESHIAVSIVANPAGQPRVVGGFRLDPPFNVDNYEGVDVVARPGGWRLYLLVDDNFSDTQQTLLTAFDWSPPQ